MTSFYQIHPARSMISSRVNQTQLEGTANPLFTRSFAVNRSGRVLPQTTESSHD